jgi:hypothetical protein
MGMDGIAGITLAWAALALALGGCAAPGREAIVPTAERRSFTVTVNRYEDPKVVGLVCERQGARYIATRILGCSSYDPTSDTLTMWVHEPHHVHDDESFAVIGHELWHAVMGDFHKQ